MSRKLPPQSPRFVRRMAPLALVAGILVGIVLPLVYERFAVAERRGEAGAFARQISLGIEVLARERPHLWPYDIGRLQAMAAPLRRAPINAHIRLDLSDSNGVFATDDFIENGADGWAVVAVEGRPVGRVLVRLDTSATRRAVIMARWGGGILGLVLAAALFLLPLATVCKGDARSQDLWQALADANAQLERRVIERTTQLQAREVELQQLGARLVEVQEEERKRISRDLHDELGQTLTGLRLQLTLAQQTASETVGARLAQAIEAIDEGVEQVRNLAHNLRPPALDALGLPAALQSHAERWAHTSGLTLETELEAFEPPPLVAEVLFRIAQEALTNIARHAEARSARIALARVDDGIGLEVDDDGRGFKGPRDGGLGLVGARERAEQAGGYLDVEASPSGGTRIRVWLPEA